MIPETRFTSVDGDAVGYQVFGDGPVNLVVIANWTLSMELLWENAEMARALRRLGGFARVLLFDQRGVGVSDGVPPDPAERVAPMENTVDEVRALLDAAGFNRAALLSLDLGAYTAVLCAAAWPRRIAALAMLNPLARAGRAEDYAIGITQEQWAPHLERFRAAVAEERFLELMTETRHSAEFVAWYNRALRLSIRRRIQRNFWDGAMDCDTRGALPVVACPTLVLHRRSWLIPRRFSRYVAEHIRGATFKEMPGQGLLWFAEHSDPVLDEIQAFLTGEQPEPVGDRIFATVLFTDIAGSTEQAVKLGDRAWAEVLARHHALVRREVERFRGREVDNAGDGFFVTFDGPGRALRCARAIREAVQALPVAVRIGVHAGECELVDGKPSGVAVHTASRVMGQAQGGEIVVSRTVKDLVAGSGLEFAERGACELRGVPGTWELFAAS
jgi:class 3 adenylate cyclase